MAKEDKERKAWNTMTFRQLDGRALIEHALSLGGTTSLDALNYLEELTAREPVTDAIREEKRKELAGKYKRVKDTDGNLIETDKPLYSEKQIEKMLVELKGTPKYSPLTVKRMYCEKYYPTILENKKEQSFADMIAEAKAKAKERI